MKHQRSGFTIIEILVVIGIIGLLSSIILVGLTSFRQRGRDARRVSDLRQVQNALELYYAKNSAYPISGVGDWEGLGSVLGGAGIGVDRIAKDPTVGKKYYYLTDDHGQSYIIGASLEVTGSSLFSDSYAGGISGAPPPEFTIGTTPLLSSCSPPYYCVKF